MINVLRKKEVSPLALSSLVSKTGDFAHDVVFALIAIEMLSANYFYIGVVYFLRYIPYLILGPVGGWLSDKYPYKYNMIGSDTFRLVVAFFLYILYVTNSMDIFSLTACGMLFTVGRSIYQPSFRSYLPEIMSDEVLPVGNSLFQVIEDASSILGPLICSILIINFSKSYVLLFDTFTYAVSVLLLLFISKNTSKHEKIFSIASLISETKETILGLKQNNSRLFMVVIGTSSSVLFTAALLRYVFPAAMVAEFGREEFVGYVFSLMSVGTVTGGLLYTKIVKKTTAVIVMKSWMIYGVLFFLVALALKINLVIMLVSVFCLGFSGAIVDISIITCIQTLSRGNVGRNYGIYSTVANACEALSGVIAGLFYIVIGSFSFPVMAILVGVSAKISMSISVKKNEQE